MRDELRTVVANWLRQAGGDGQLPEGVAAEGWVADRVMDWIEKNILDEAADELDRAGISVEAAQQELMRLGGWEHFGEALHELAHAYHDQFLSFNNQRIIDVYDKAMAAGLYDKVLLYNGKKVRHYGANNHKEYFAEGTESFFYRNDFYPFVAAELKEHDPALYNLLVEIWGPLK